MLYLWGCEMSDKERLRIIEMLSMKVGDKVIYYWGKGEYLAVITKVHSHRDGEIYGLMIDTEIRGKVYVCPLEVRKC